MSFPQARQDASPARWGGEHFQHRVHHGSSIANDVDDTTVGIQGMNERKAQGIAGRFFTETRFAVPHLEVMKASVNVTGNGGIEMLGKQAIIALPGVSPTPYGSRFFPVGDVRVLRQKISQHGGAGPGAAHDEDRLTNFSRLLDGVHESLRLPTRTAGLPA